MTPQEQKNVEASFREDAADEIERFKFENRILKLLIKKSRHQEYEQTRELMPYEQRILDKFNGVPISRKELIESGFKEGTLLRGIAKLHRAGKIKTVSRGLYQRT